MEEGSFQTVISILPMNLSTPSSEEVRIMLASAGDAEAEAEALAINKTPVLHRYISMSSPAILLVV